MNQQKYLKWYNKIGYGSGYMCVDIALRGVGSHACGPALPEKYEIPRRGKNRFRFVF